MKKLSKVWGIFVLLTFVGLSFLSCTENTHEEETLISEQTETLSQDEIKHYLHLGDSISTHMQKTLLENVSQAMQKGGSDYAVEFCNIQAIPLTDSISNMHHVSIQRLSDKNRNPNNVLALEEDLSAFEKLKDSTLPVDFIQNNMGEITYYKSIKLGMPTCLKCHGGKEDISESTLAIIQDKYPNDKAIEYQMGELRGMWKIKF